jgi:pyrophosphatase PpaX
MQTTHSIKALLFDLDGTILDSKKSVLDATYFVAEQYAPGRFTYQEIESRFGESLDQFIKQLGSGKREEILVSYLERIESDHDSLVQPFPGIAKNLQALRQMGYKLAVVTNKQRNLTERELQLFSLRHLFQVVVTLDDVQEGKPSAEPIEKACLQLQVTQQEAMMVGDSVVDVQAARAAQVCCAVVNWYKPYHYPQWEPEYRFDNIGQLVASLFLQHGKEIQEKEVADLTY